MTRDGAWTALRLALVAVVLAGPACAPSPGDPGPGTEPFRADGVAVRSDGGEFGAADVRGEVRGSYTSWTVETVCLDESGCRGELLVTVRWRTESGERTTRLGSSVDVGAGRPVVVHGVSRPGERVSGVDGVRFELTRPPASGSRTPPVID